MSDDSRTYSFPLQTGVTGDVLRFSAPAPIRGLTVVNQSSVTISVFKGGLASPNAVPDFKVYPGQFQATPIPQSSTVALRFDGASSTSTGQAYAHFTTDLVAASSGSIATSAPVSSNPFALLSEGNNLTGVSTFVDSHGRTIAYFEITDGAPPAKSPTGNGANIFVQSLCVSGIPIYVTVGVMFTSVSLPAGWVPLMTGPGIWTAAQAVGFGATGASAPRAFFCFYNFDSIVQLSSVALNALLTGYVQ